MTQPAWPSMEWNFLGHDYDTQSSYYGTQKACEPVHAQLNLSDESVDLINLGDAGKFGVRVLVTGLDGKVLNDETKSVQAAANARTSIGKLELSRLAGAHAVFVKLEVKDAAGAMVSDNFYWWSKEDAGLQELDGLPQATVDSSASVARDGQEKIVTVKLRNRGSEAALLLKLTLDNSVTGERILPAYYSENYASLLPSEERVITIRYPADSSTPAIGLRGWNLGSITIAVR